MCKVFRLKLLENFEYVLYRAKLAYIELDRLQINYEPLKKHLIEIEDRDFYKNNGVSYKSLLRATISQMPIFRKKFKYIESGGSTITMQLVRTLFIPSNQNRFKRKIFEVLLTKWITFQFTKDEIIKLYIASVRYERGVIGLTNAIKYFSLGEVRSKKLTTEESFFLVERLSNITSTIRWSRIEHLRSRTTQQIDQTKLADIYNDKAQKGLLKLQ